MLENENELVHEKREELINNILESTNESKNPDLAKLLYLHNFILSTVEYPKVNIKNDLDDATKANYLNSYGVLVDRKAVCYGIAKEIQKVLEDPRINIKNRYVEGRCVNPKLGKVVHVWNIVYLDNMPYHLDTTLDITRNPNVIKGKVEDEKNEIPNCKALKISIENFLVGDKKMEPDHFWKDKIHPKCLKDRSVDEIKKNDFLSSNKKC